MGFSRLLMYETNNSSPYVDYGEVVSIINDKLVNINMGGEKDAQGNLVILESVMVQGNYVPKIGDWVTISWSSGQPIANGGHVGSNSSGLININNDVKIISQTDLASNVVNSDHIRANTIEAYHIQAGSITTQLLSANSVTADKIAAGAITAIHISANTITGDKIVAGSITSTQISAGSITTNLLSANSITSDKIAANQISGGHIVAGTIDAGKLTVSARIQGLLTQYFTNSGGTSKFETFKGTRIESILDIDWGTGSPSIVGASNNWSGRFQGMIFSPEAGEYAFFVNADDGARLWIDNVLVVDAWSGNAGVEVGNIITLSRDVWSTIRLDYHQTTGNAKFYVKWKTPSMGVAGYIPSMYLTQAQTVIDGGAILTNTITASAIKVGTITAASGVIGDAAITNANIANAAISSAKIGNAEIKTAHIEAGNITTALIADASITNAKIVSLDAGKITTGYLNAGLISAGSIIGSMISGSTITGDKIAANTIDSLNIKAGSITSTKIAAGSISSDRIMAGAITADKIESGAINASHISTVGLDAQLINVYDSKTGETLIGGGYLRTGGLDVGVVQSDNLIGNGLFLSASSNYGYKRDNPVGEALLGSNSYIPGGNQIWKIDIANGNIVNRLDIPSRKPVDIDLDGNGTFAYVTVQGDDSLVQIDLSNFVLTNKKLKLSAGPSVIKWTGDALGDMKHLFALNTDPMDMHIPDSISIIDVPPHSVNGDVYVHHQILLGNEPYDYVIDPTTKYTYITQASQGDIAILDVSDPITTNWSVIRHIPIAAYATDNYHGGVSSNYGLGVVVGGDTSAQYDAKAGTGTGMGGMSGGHNHGVGGGYGASSGTLKTYSPHGIALSTDSDTLYVVDYANGELLVVSKSGKAPYNTLTGRHDTSVSGGTQLTFLSPWMPAQVPVGMVGVMAVMPHMAGIQSPAMSVSMGASSGGGPTTNWVRYRIPIGDAPEFVEVKNGKILVTLEGSGKIAIIDESTIINAINADRAFYATWNSSRPMNPYPTIPVRTVDLGAKPTFIDSSSAGKLYIALNGQNQIAVFDMALETITARFSTGSNPKGLVVSRDGAYLYVVNNGGSGDLSFVYPQGSFIGDAYLGLEGMVEYQGAEHWTPDRSNWIVDASGNIKSSSSVEFRINEPFLNEGGYAKLTANGVDYQYAQIEQDIYNVVNYSNGNNVINSVAEKLLSDSGNTIFYPKNEWINNPAPSNVKIVSHSGSGNIVKTPANPSTYQIYYGNGYNSRMVFSGGVVASGNWVEVDYTAKNNIYFKPHNGSIEIAIENSSSPNFNTTFEMDELVPKFITIDNRQTSNFTPTQNGINETYSGLEYSDKTNRAFKIAPAQITLSGGANVSTYRSHDGDGSILDIGRIVNGDMNSHFDAGVGKATVTLDLGKTYMVPMIHILHYYLDSRTYHNTKTEVSEDGFVWTTVRDSVISGEYVEDYRGNPLMIMLDAKPVRYVRDTVNGSTVDAASHWVEIEVFGDWEVEYGYVYPSNSTHAGLQIATNGKSFVSTDIKDASIAVDLQVEFTTWWYMTYIVSPGFGTLKVDMVSQGMSHFLFLDSTYTNKVAHRHIMPFPPSINIKADVANGIKAGKHRAIIRQVSGKITIDRFRFEDFQFFNKSSLLVTSQAPATFQRYKLVTEQAKWFVGSGNQSTFGAYDELRRNPDTGLPDYSVPIKYRMRVKSELNPSGGVTERGIAYATSAIVETGKQSTHWRRSEGIDSYPGNRIESWDGNQPHKTGIQDFHLANGAVRGEKILPSAIMDYHISPYARISESKLKLKYPSHGHDNKNILDVITGLTTGGNIGSGNVVVTYPYLTGNFYTKSQVDSLALSGSATSGNSVPITRIINAGTGLAGGGSLQNDIVISLDTVYTDTLYAKLSGDSVINGVLYITGNIYLNGQSVSGGNAGVTGNFVKSDVSGQSVLGNFSVNGDGRMWVGSSTSGGGQIAVRDTNGVNRIQLDGITSNNPLTNVLAYIDLSGNARFSGNVTMKSFTINTTNVIPNLNAQMINYVKEVDLVKNISIVEISGHGVGTGLSVSSQQIPNMTVLIEEGVVFTTSGRRVDASARSIALSAASASYDRLDAVITLGPSAGNNEGNISIVLGVPSAIPDYPTIPSDAVMLAYIRVRKNAGSILSTDVIDARYWKAVKFILEDGYLDINKTRISTLGSYGNAIYFEKPVKANGWATSLVISSGNASITWNHNLDLSAYVITFSVNSPHRHVHWSGKTANSIVINLDDVAGSDIFIDAVITAI